MDSRRGLVFVICGRDTGKVTKFLSFGFTLLSKEKVSRIESDFLVIVGNQRSEEKMLAFNGRKKGKKNINKLSWLKANSNKKDYVIYCPTFRLNDILDILIVWQKMHGLKKDI